ncbi:conserved hypothetical protein [Ricinus communis]|uniref:Uncharacterized protein n=1 Tax=Ricinus communis TaxID=3988 RepID=B9RAF0_RICCO|nr:conserved hypothetical protein [Ricinus communis]
MADGLLWKQQFTSLILMQYGSKDLRIILVDGEAGIAKASSTLLAEAQALLNMIKETSLRRRRRRRSSNIKRSLTNKGASSQEGGLEPEQPRWFVA